MNSSILQRKLTSKLAVLLMTLPVTGTFAAYDYSSTVSAYNSGTSKATYAANDVLKATLAASSVTKAGTSTDLNTNYIGWSVTPTQAINLYWTTTGLADTAATADDFTIGGAVASGTTASSSFNTLTVADYVTVGAVNLAIGTGSLVGGSGTDKALVDTTKPANSNAVTVTGAAYQSATPSGIVATTLNLSGAITVGTYGNGNALGIASGAHVTASGALSVGISDANNTTYGSNNSVSIDGKVSVSVVGYTGSSVSTLTAVGGDIGTYGSNNTLTVSNNGVLNLGIGSLMVGRYGKGNSVSASSGASILAQGEIITGAKPSATANSMTLDNATLSGTTTLPTGFFYVGLFGSSNTFAATKSTIYSSNVYVGYGDDEKDKDNPYDGTEGYVASEGSNNTASVTSSTIRTAGNVTVGLYGSGNTATISGSSLYSVWTDAGATPDGLVQLSEITTGIATLNVGCGYNPSSETTDYTAFGSNNALTIDNASVFSVTGCIVVGDQGHGNKLDIKGGTKGYAAQDVMLGMGNSYGTAYGSSNEMTLTGTGTSLGLGGDIYFANYGSNNAITISGGAALTVAKSLANFGYGFESTATVDNTAYGSSNVVTVTGKDSSLTITNSHEDDIWIGYFGSNNQLVIADKASVSIDGSDCTVTLGYYGEELGNVINSNRVYSHGNKISVSGGASFSVADTLVVGADGINNALDITGADSAVTIGNYLVIGNGSNGATYGSGNTLTVSNDAALIVPMLAVGSFKDSSSSNNTATISSGAVVVVTKAFKINNYDGEKNALRLNGGMLALKGKGLDIDYATVTWADYIFNGYVYEDKIADQITGVSLVDMGSIEVWDASTSSYVKAKKSDLSLKYYASEAEAVAATGYAGLAGYSVLTQANDLSRLAWAGSVYDAGSNVYCSSWYGWFYNDAAYGDYIMSYNDYAWQYVAPDSTPDSTYIYDTKLGAWLFTNQTYFENKWVYNYATSAWQKLGE
jgi:hypothetical protein